MLTILTMTGERPQAWALCQRWMARQTYQGSVHWVIVDDGETPQEIDFQRDGWSLSVVRPEPFWKPGQNTQARNILAGLELVSADAKLVIVEDDDWYSADWLDKVDQALDKAELIGESCATYYNIALRRVRRMQNFRHASLCSSGMRGQAIQTFRSVCRPSIQFIDVMLWEAHGSKQLFEGQSVIGMKGMPGRKGIGTGHNKQFMGAFDKNGRLLRDLIGSDAAYYLGEENDAEADQTK